jgi:hypothetical protein
MPTLLFIIFLSFLTLPGYTLAELTGLARSSVAAQRVAALRALSAVLRKANEDANTHRRRRATTTLKTTTTTTTTTKTTQMETAKTTTSSSASASASAVRWPGFHYQYPFVSRRKAHDTSNNNNNATVAVAVAVAVESVSKVIVDTGAGATVPFATHLLEHLTAAHSIYVGCCFYVFVSVFGF